MFIYKLDEFLEKIEQDANDAKKVVKEEVTGREKSLLLDRPLAQLIGDRLKQLKPYRVISRVTPTLESDVDLQLILNGTQPIAGIPYIVYQASGITLERDGDTGVYDARSLAKAIREMVK